MKLSALLLAIGLSTTLQAARPKDDIRGKIGSVFGSPVKVGEKYYFVATTGVLYEGNKDFSHATRLYEGKRQTLGNVVHHEGKLYWGDGIHDDKKSSLYVYDIRSRKVTPVEIDGHVQRPVHFHDGLIIVPAGPGGVAALNKETLKPVWQSKTHEGKPVHVDSNLLSAGEKICGTSVYETKGVLCFEAKTGKVLQLGTLKRNPKSEITMWKNHIVGFSTEADLMKTKFDIPADFFVYDIEGNKFKHNKELRGFNFFAPSVEGDDAFITLSTGDFIIFNLQSGKIDFLGEFPEPFLNNSFRQGKTYCGIGIMGKYMCYLKTKAGYALKTDKRLMETVVGRILSGDRLIVPTRIGYYTE